MNMTSPETLIIQEETIVQTGLQQRGKLARSSDAHFTERSELWDRMRLLLSSAKRGRDRTSQGSRLQPVQDSAKANTSPGFRVTERTEDPVLALLCT